MATFGFNTCHTAEAILDVLRPVFEDRIISCRADVVWPPRSCELTPLDYYFWRAVKDKCYADKPETIDALKDNIREAFGEIQLHTIDNVLKIWNIWCWKMDVGLLGVKPGFDSQARHQNQIQKVFLRRFPLSRFLAKTLRVNQNWREKFHKKSVVQSRL